jgi:hypothetical protein
MNITFNKIIRAFLPGIVPYLYYEVRDYMKNRLDSKNGTLFDGDDHLFKRTLLDAQHYGEYGCGASTRWVLLQTNVRVDAVDTSGDWVGNVLNGMNTAVLSRARISHVDLGPVEAWGRPVSYNKRHDFSVYTDKIWQDNPSLDTILIDGRFRVCCFLTSLKYAAVGTRLIFDDYTDRPYYHVVEKFIQRKEVCGRQCLFVVPNKSSINLGELDAEIERFRYVMD